MKLYVKISLYIAAFLCGIASVTLIFAVNIMGSKLNITIDSESTNLSTALDGAELKSVPNDSIPQGTFIYDLHFAEWNGRMPNTPVEVTISGDKVIVRKTKETNLSGDDLILESTIKRHRSGSWIITDNESDIYSEELGGCSGGGIPIDFESKTIEFC